MRVGIRDLLARQARCVLHALAVLIASGTFLMLLPAFCGRRIGTRVEVGPSPTITVDYQRDWRGDRLLPG
jgi:hypothetical protein